MNKKTWLIAIVLIIVSVGGFLAYYFLFIDKEQALAPEVPQKEVSKTQGKEVDTTGWKLYQNKQFNYELKYPADWEIGTTFGADPTTFSAPSFSPPNCLVNGSGICPEFMVGNVHKIEAGENIEPDIRLDSNDKLIEKKNLIISGEEASFIEYYQGNYGLSDGGQGLVRQEMKVIHNGTMYRIYVDEKTYPSSSSRILSSADWKYKKTFEAMLESFRFVDDVSTKSEEVSSGVLYSNQELGFSVLLPAGWEKYQVSIQWDKGDDKHTYIYFLLPTTDKNISAYDKNTGKFMPGWADIFAITATDAETWNKDVASKECQENPNPDCPQVGNVVGKNKQYVFSASYGNGIIPEDVEKFVEGTSASKFLSGKFKLL